ncbi:MAG TPA: acylphosphatase, partial [Nitrospira sp.]|nr:acylphosphatase [Nitrospira sp.]
MGEVAQNHEAGQEVVSLEVRVGGRVQGVGFRYFAHAAARRLELVGYVKNVPDGTVRVYAEGTRASLVEFLRQMQQGPAGAIVREARAHWNRATGQYTYFDIERSGW